MLKILSHENMHITFSCSCVLLKYSPLQFNCICVYLAATNPEPAQVTLRGKNMEEGLQNVVEKQSQHKNLIILSLPE